MKILTSNFSDDDNERDSFKMVSTKLRRYTRSKIKDTDTPLFEAKIDDAASHLYNGRVLDACA